MSLFCLGDEFWRLGAFADRRVAVFEDVRPETVAAIVTAMRTVDQQRQARADVVFEKYKHFEKAKKVMEIMTTHFKVLGEYERSKQ